MTPKATAPRDGRRRIVLRYHASPQRILGEERATEAQLAAGTIDAGLSSPPSATAAAPVRELAADLNAELIHSRDRLPSYT